MNQETNRCNFCGEIKPVLRFYVKVRDRHLDGVNEVRGKYSDFFYYCSDCGVKTNTTDKVAELIEEYKTANFPPDFLNRLIEVIHPDYELPISMLKLKNLTILQSTSRM